MSNKGEAILELDLMEGFYFLPVVIEYTFFPRIPQRGPTWDCAGEPEEPAAVEIEKIESAEPDRELPDWLLELIWQFVMEHKLDDLLAIAKEEFGEEEEH